MERLVLSYIISEPLCFPRTRFAKCEWGAVAVAAAQLLASLLMEMENDDDDDNDDNKRANTANNNIIMAQVSQTQ